jgi:hypothetical protein
MSRQLIQIEIHAKHLKRLIQIRQKHRKPVSLLLTRLDELRDEYRKRKAEIQSGPAQNPQFDFEKGSAPGKRTDSGPTTEGLDHPDYQNGLKELRRAAL